MSIHSGIPRRRSIIALTTASAIAIFALAGCSVSPAQHAGSNASKKAFSTDAATATDAKLIAGIKPDPAAVAMRNGKWNSITVGDALYAPPSSFQKGSDAAGYEPDLIMAIGKKLGAKITIKNAPFATLITGLQAGRFDVLISNLNDNEARRKVVDFVDYGQDSVAYLVAKGNPQKITSDVTSLCGKTIDGLQGSAEVTWAQGENDSECSASKKMEIVAVPDAATALNDLRTGRAALFLSQASIAPYTAATARGGTTLDAIVPRPAASPALIGIPVNKTDTALRDAVRAALESLIKDGTYDKILRTWHVQSTAISSATINAGQ